MRYSCGHCETILPLAVFKLYKKKPFWLNDNFWVILNNVYAAHCECGVYNFLFSDSDIMKIKDVVVRELAELPAPLSGEQFDWAAVYLINKTIHNEVLALWLGWDGFYEPKKPKVVEKHIFRCLIKRLNYNSPKQLFKLTKMSSIPQEVDVVMKSIMKMVDDPNGIPARVGFSKRTGKYFIAVDLASWSRKWAKKNGGKALFIKWKKINDFFKRMKAKPIPWMAFKTFINELNGEVFCLYSRTGRTVQATVFAYLDKKKDFVHVTKFLMSPQLIKNNDALAVLFLRVIDLARNNKVSEVTLEMPAQITIAQEAEKVGFRHYPKGFLTMTLVYPS